MTSQDIISSVFQAGVVGAGGGGFPTHVKLQARVDTVLANGSECEPLLQSDKTLIKLHADQVIEGLKLARQATGATNGVVAVKGHSEDVVAALESSLKNESHIRLHKLRNYYPAGDEFLTVYDVTGRIIPEGGLPLHVGVVVCNVLTLAQITQAVSGKAVTERWVTVAGEVNKPCVVQVPIGTTYQEIIRLAGGLTDSNAVLIDGGPLMGALVSDARAGIAKTTSGVLALPKESLVVRQKTLTTGQMVKLSKAACCQCFRCSDLCPRNLLGHAIFPHKTMRTIDYNVSEPTENITSAFLCSQCGVCETIACDSMLLSPKKIYAEYRKELVKRGVKNPHTKKVERVNSAFEDRKVSVDMVLKKLNLSRYKADVAHLGFQDAQHVMIPIGKHVGVKSVPVIRVNQQVNKGDLVAACPTVGANGNSPVLGANYHASISGKVIDVNENFIEITN